MLMQISTSSAMLKMLLVCHKQTLKIMLKAAAPDLSADDNEPSTSGLRERGDLPVPYILPEFDLETKVALDRMQREFISSSATYLPPRHEKGRILSCLSADIFKYKSYPSDGDCDIVTKTLVASYYQLPTTNTILLQTPIDT